MSEYRNTLERELERLSPPRIPLDQLVRRRDRKLRGQRIRAGLLGLAIAIGVGSLGVNVIRSTSTPGGDPDSPFWGIWLTTDIDGSTQTMTMRTSGDGSVQIVVHDDDASVCSGLPSTMMGTGRLVSASALVIPSPVLTCDDGSQPEALSGPPLQEQLHNLTFVHEPETDTLTDSSGSVWERVGGEDPSPDQVTPLWPQSSLEEVREAQRLADAGDPRYTWQVDPKLRSGFAQPTDDTEIIARFLREELGWQDFRFMPIPEDSFGTGATYNNAYIRCAPGGTNPLYPKDPRGRACAPTIDDTRYERVSIDLRQLVRQDRSGIWVVTRWGTLPPFEEVVPPSEAETTELLEAFLQARIDGEGAQEYLDRPEDEIPFLYSTTTGAPYERSEFEVVDGPVWPDGWMRFKIRLFAEDGETVVEQFFSLESYELGLGYESETGGPAGPVPGTTVNGQAVPVPYSFFDGEVTLHAAYPWHDSWTGEPGPRPTLFLDEFEANVVLVADPLPSPTGCLEGPAPADAQALARSIRSDTDLDATAPVAVTVGGVEALRMDVTVAAGASVCDPGAGRGPLVVSDTELYQGYRMRLYLLDFPEGSSGRILAIAIVAPQANSDRAVESAASIVDSFEFHTG